jgi:hypothetical protein
MNVIVVTIFLIFVIVILSISYIKSDVTGANNNKIKRKYQNKTNEIENSRTPTNVSNKIQKVIDRTNDLLTSLSNGTTGNNANNRNTGNNGNNGNNENNGNNRNTGNNGNNENNGNNGNNRNTGNNGNNENNGNNRNTGNNGNNGNNRNNENTGNNGNNENNGNNGNNRNTGNNDNGSFSFFGNTGNTGNNGNNGNNDSKMFKSLDDMLKSFYGFIKSKRLSEIFDIQILKQRFIALSTKINNNTPVIDINFNILDNFSISQFQYIMIDLILDIVEILQQKKHDNTILMSILYDLINSTIINNEALFENMLSEIILKITSLLEKKRDEYSATIKDIHTKIKDKYELFMKQFEKRLIELFNKIKLLTEEANGTEGDKINFDGDFSKDNLDQVLNKLEEFFEKKNSQGTTDTNSSRPRGTGTEHHEYDFVRVHDSDTFEKMKSILSTEQEIVREVRTQYVEIVKKLEDELKKYYNLTKLIYAIKSKDDILIHANEAFLNELEKLRDESISRSKSYKIPNQDQTSSSSNIESISSSLEILGKIILQGDDEKLSSFMKLYKDKPTNWITLALDLLIDNMYNSFMIKEDMIKELITQKEVLENKLLDELGKNLINYKKYSDKVYDLEQKIEAGEKIKKLQQNKMSLIIDRQNAEINRLKEDHENHEKNKNEISEIIRQKKNVEDDLLFEKQVYEFNENRYIKLNQVYIDLLNEFNKLKDTLKQSPIVGDPTNNSINVLKSSQLARIEQLENIIAEQNKQIICTENMGNQEEFDKLNDVIEMLIAQLSQYQSELTDDNQLQTQMKNIRSKYQTNLQTFKNEQNELYENKINEITVENTKRLKELNDIIKFFQTEQKKHNIANEQMILELESSEQLIATLNTQIKNSNSSNSLLSLQLKKENEKYEKLLKNQTEYKQDILDKDETIKLKIKNLEESKSQFEARIASLTQQNDDLVAKNMKHVSDVTELESKFAILNALFLKQNAELENLENTQHNQLTTTQTTLEEKAELEKQNTALEKQNTELLKEKDELSNTQEQLKEKSQELDTTKKQLEITQKQLGETTQKQLEEKAELELKEKSQLKELDTIKTQLETAQEQLKVKSQELDTIKTQLETAQEQLKVQSQELDIIKTQLETAQEQLKVKSQLEEKSQLELEDKKIKLEEEKKKLEEEKKKLEEEKIKLEGKIKKLEEEKKKLEEEKKKLEEEKKKLEGKLKSEVKSLHEEKSQLELKVKSQHEEKSQLEGKIKKLEDKLKNQHEQTTQNEIVIKNLEENLKLKVTKNSLDTTKTQLEEAQKQLKITQKQLEESKAQNILKDQNILKAQNLLQTLNEKLFNNKGTMDNITSELITEWYENEHETHMNKLQLTNLDLLRQIKQLQEDKLTNIFDSKFKGKPFTQYHLKAFGDLLSTNVMKILKYYNLNNGINFESIKYDDKNRTYVELFYDIILNVFGILQEKCIAKIIITDNNEYLINEKFTNINTPFAIMLKVGKEYKKKFEVSTKISDKKSFFETHKSIFNIISKNDLDFDVNSNNNTDDDIVISMYINTNPPDKIDETYTTLKFQNDTQIKYNLYEYNNLVKTNGNFKVLRNDLVFTNKLYIHQHRGKNQQNGGKLIGNNFGIYIWKIFLPMYIIKLLRYRYLIKNKHENNRHLNDFCINLICCLFLYSIQDTYLLYPYIIDLVCTSFAYQICSNENIIVYPFFLSYMFVNYE